MGLIPPLRCLWIAAAISSERPFAAVSTDGAQVLAAPCLNFPPAAQPLSKTTQGSSSEIDRLAGRASPSRGVRCLLICHKGTHRSCRTRNRDLRATPAPEAREPSRYAQAAR